MARNVAWAACRTLQGAGWARLPHARLSVIHKYRQPIRMLQAVDAAADYRCTVCGLEWRRHRAGWRLLGGGRDAGGGGNAVTEPAPQRARKTPSGGRRLYRILVALAIAQAAAQAFTSRPGLLGSGLAAPAHPTQVLLLAAILFTALHFARGCSLRSVAALSGLGKWHWLRRPSPRLRARQRAVRGAREPAPPRRRSDRSAGPRAPHAPARGNSDAPRS